MAKTNSRWCQDSNEPLFVINWSTLAELEKIDLASVFGRILVIFAKNQNFETAFIFSLPLEQLFC